eukprot:GHVT01082132.1.p2 GENE.GHVT01082132.1~~GHVT01082132.1.p2  ORF type:complete len:105 (+),score=17.28 GHVT01082132.1:162-476(+)
MRMIAIQKVAKMAINPAAGKHLVRTEEEAEAGLARARRKAAKEETAEEEKIVRTEEVGNNGQKYLENNQQQLPYHKREHFNYLYTLSATEGNYQVKFYIRKLYV